mmetsp:Transcript_1505/g.3232  ORF Transcript_1505/g.3232 Transcript_1505/m.3232 type:complete len:110 (+) Transcript_1505:302-631(+)
MCAATASVQPPAVRQHHIFRMPRPADHDTFGSLSGPRTSSHDRRHAAKFKTNEIIFVAQRHAPVQLPAGTSKLRLRTPQRPQQQPEAGLAAAVPGSPPGACAAIPTLMP